MVTTIKTDIQCLFGLILALVQHQGEEEDGIWMHQATKRSLLLEERGLTSEIAKKQSKLG